MTEQLHQLCAKQIVVRELQLTDELAYVAMVESLGGNDPHMFKPFQPEGLTFSELFQFLQKCKNGIDLAPGRVADTCLFAFYEECIVGRLSLRHQLNAFLEQIGGHIGYAVLPQYRGRGVATLMLQTSLAHARALGLSRVLLTCDETNEASRRVIEKCGGIYEDTRKTESIPAKRRYWISI